MVRNPLHILIPEWTELSAEEQKIIYRKAARQAAKGVSFWWVQAGSIFGFTLVSLALIWMTVMAHLQVDMLIDQNSKINTLETAVSNLAPKADPVLAPLAAQSLGKDPNWEMISWLVKYHIPIESTIAISLLISFFFSIYVTKIAELYTILPFLRTLIQKRKAA